MFWDDIIEILSFVREIRVHQISQENRHEEIDNGKDIFCKLEQIDEHLDRIQDNIVNVDKLVAPDGIIERYDSQISKIDLMLNEFKGCISMSRASLTEKKEFDECLSNLKKICKKFELADEYHRSLTNQHFKIEQIYKILTEQFGEIEVKKKTVRKRKTKKITEE